MATEYRTARQDVVKLVEELIAEFHPELLDARIGLLMRVPAPINGDKTVFAKARKVPLEQKQFMAYDFVIWFADEIWASLEPYQRRALVDHELCHCTMTDEGDAKMRLHDLEEFLVIIERHGFWWPQAKQAQEVFQARLGLELERLGVVEAIAAEKDVLDQVDEFFSEEDGDA